MFIQSVLETQSLLNDIDKHIASSHYKVEYIVKELGINTGTYYRKLREKRFEVSELIKIVQLLYPKEFDKYYINSRLELAIDQVKEGLTYTTEEVMGEYRKKYLNK